MTVRELLERIDSRELTEWMAYDSIEPFGERLADLRNGILCALTANIHKKQSATASKPADFMPGRKRRKSQQQIANFFDRWAVAQTAMHTRTNGNHR